MKIRFCDVCLHLPVGEIFTITAKGRTFDVCSQCDEKPFKVPTPAHATVTLTDGDPGVAVIVDARVR